MKLTSRKDIEAPIAFVFAALKDFDAWERAALRRGADVVRTDKLTTIMPGLSWLVKFAYRGKERRVAVELTRMEPPTVMGFFGDGAAFEGLAGIDLMELASRRTRLSLTVDLKPKSMASRLILQSLKLARARVTRRFDDRVAAICIEVEKRYRQSVRG